MFETPPLRLTLYLILLILLLIPATLAQYNTSVCSSLTDYYFDTTYLNCETCKSHASPNSDDLSCSCDYGYRYSQGEALIGWNGDCVQCTSGAPSSDLTRCVLCPTGADYSSTLGDCNCGTGKVPVDIAEDGSQLDEKVCVTCATGAYPGPYGRPSQCKLCGYGKVWEEVTTGEAWECVCDEANGYNTAGDTCVSDDDLSTYSSYITDYQTYSFPDIENTDGSTDSADITDAQALSYYYYKALVGCGKYHDPEQCQVFGNLCTLAMYDETSVVCRAFRFQTSSGDRVGSDEGWKEGYPWLYYENNPTSIINNANFDLTVTLGKGSTSEVSQIPYYITRYALNGTYLGIVQLTNQLLACPNSVAAGDTIKTFGTPYTSSCDLDLSLFEDTETVFYELFLKDSDSTYHDIPVKIKNLQTSSNVYPNDNDEISSSTQFTRRFVVYDTSSGVSTSGGFTYLRFAKTMRLVVTVKDSDHTKINRPYLEIEYRSKRVKDFSTNSTSYATFKTEFTMDIKGFWKTCKILFIIANIIVGVAAVFKTYVWSRFNPSRFYGENWTVIMVARFIIITMKTWSDAMFFFLFVMTGYWFVFYKMQNTVYFLVPDPSSNPSDYRPFVIVFVIMVIFQFLAALNMVREQVQMDFFFIDWEKPKLTFKREVNREVYFQSAWRMILIANEWNELQVERHYRVELLYVIFGFFAIGLKWEKLNAIIPTMTTHVDSGIPTSYILKYFIDVFLLFVISMILYGLRKLIILRFPTPVQEFTDLCSIANISIIVFDKQFHGYYLHGMAPSGQAEGSIGELKRSLELESKGTVRGRGLLANDSTNLQTFEMFLPWEFRQAYNNLYKAEITKEIYARQAQQQMTNTINLKVMNKALPADFDYARLEGRRLVIQEHLKLYIEGVKVESAKLIREKTPAMRFFGIPPIDIETFQGNPLFYRDPGYGFQNTIFYGNEFALIIFDIVILTMWDMIFKNTFIAIFASYFTNKAFAWIRSFFGERNISQKALVDDAFLI